MSKKIIGIDLGGTSVKLAILTEEGDIQDKWTIKTNCLDEGQHIIPDIIESIRHRLDANDLEWSDFLGIGMGSPGVVDRKAGTVRGAYNLNWADRQEVKTQMETALNLPFFIDNDANVAALGERWIGAGENDPDVVFMTLGTGVGGGVIAGGRLIHGKGGAGGELGHIPVDFSQPLQCTCGKKGCLETVASATGIVNLTHRCYEKNSTVNSPLAALLKAGEPFTAKTVFDLAKEGDDLALQVYQQFSHYLGTACAQIACILNPSRIVLGGGVSAAGDFLLSGVSQVFSQNVYPPTRETTKLSLAQLGNDAGVIGAASLVLQSERKTD